jgi:hypothetical protein
MTTNKTRKNIGKEAKAKCEKIYCVNYTRKMQKFGDKIRTELLKRIKTKITDLEKKSEKNEEEIKELRIYKKDWDRIQKNIRKIGLKKMQEKINRKTMKLCKKAYCNPECKDTIFDKNIDLPSEILKQFKGKPKALDSMRKFKKFIFNGKKSILKNESFYNKLKNKDIERIQKEGALSGCVMLLLK